ncbi:MAG: AIR synthase-related protein, partial [Desulfuromonadales bacterium]
GIEIDASALHIYPQVLELAAIGLVPAGSYHNREYYLPNVINREQIAPEIVDILADPQTSGGLLIVIASERLQQLTTQLESAGCDAFEIGRVSDNHPGQMVVL